MTKLTSEVLRPFLDHGYGQGGSVDPQLDAILRALAAGIEAHDHGGGGEGTGDGVPIAASSLEPQLQRWLPVTISDAGVKLLQANPLTLLPAPSDHTLQLDAVALVVDATNGAYSSLPVFSVRYVGVTSALLELDGSPLENEATAAVVVKKVDYTTAQKVLVPVTGIELLADGVAVGGDPDNSFQLRVYYRVVEPWAFEGPMP